MRLTDEDPMPFGKYKGTKMKDVPAGYLLWLKDEMNKNAVPGRRIITAQAVTLYIQYNMDVLTKEVKDGRR